VNVQTEPLQSTRIQSKSDLDPFIDAWRELTSGVPMRSPEWLLGWWEVYAAPDDELCVLLFHESGGALVGLAPLFLQGVKSCRTFRLLGSGDACTTHTTWFCVAGWERRVGEEVARFLLQCKTEWRRLVFESVDADAAAIHATVECLAEDGYLLHRRQINSCWKITLPDTWDDYLRTLSRSLRKRCRKLQREFFDSGKIRICQVENETDLGKGFDILINLHAARWGSSGKPLGVFADRRFRLFHETISGKLLANGQLRLAWLECEGKPFAVEYQFFDSRAVFAYQAGADFSMDAYSPGKLTMMAAIQFAISRGCESFDLLRGDEPYKANWRAVPTACHDLRVWQRGITGCIAWSLWKMYTLTADLFKAIIPPHLIDQALKRLQAMRGA